MKNARPQRRAFFDLLGRAGYRVDIADPTLLTAAPQRWPAIKSDLQSDLQSEGAVFS
ncbi:hypothetical protein SAMN06265374_2514 [Roseibium denhamense]|uniref:Uncharacterized protein n=1 Tax=Roseibium denhamense TaxID=76305 RepID=A0ABY1P2T5_9HYPH|nr:hypothetical protein SAMN06265374_2514 [Roseibium denhamense]